MVRYHLSEDRAFEFLTRVARVNDGTIQLVAVEILREANGAARTDAIPPMAMAMAQPHPRLIVRLTES
jgi:hypothetical protein